MGILSATGRGHPPGLGFAGQGGRAPERHQLSARGGLGWLDGFNEWLVRCGLENNGQPGTDKFINNVGDEATMELTLHGKIANIPASEVEVVVEQEAPYRIHIRGRMDERMFHGPKLELQTDISTSPARHISDQRHRDQPRRERARIPAPLPRELRQPAAGGGFGLLAPVERVTPFNDRRPRG